MSKDFKEMLKNEKTKKAAVFASLGMLFAVSMYMIFAPAEKTGDDGLGENSINATVPQAAGSNLTDDKLKIYEFSTETKEEERRKFAGTLAQLQEDSIHVAMEERNEYRQDNLVQDSHIDRSVQQYKKTSEALASFYDNGQDSEKEGLLEEIERLNGEIQRMKTAENDEEDQLALLEKSYQMAAKYLPLNGNGNHVPTSGKKNDEAKNTEVAYEVLPDNRQVVSCLVQPGADGDYCRGNDRERNTGFHSPIAGEHEKGKNTIACKVDRTVTLKDNETLQLRLLESVRIDETVVPKYSLLTAKSKLSGNRMMLLVSSIEVGGSIYPVKLSAYDTDGLEGVFIPGSEEQEALKEIGADVGSSIGTSFTFASSAKDQIISDAVKGLMQGTSNYFVKKIRTVKVTFKGGHRLMLMPAK